jgi:hypothetical protein|tara:strand:- start:417 stop:1175 length:759 start_codon:yes stop_codon:yes gene_type:complete
MLYFDGTDWELADATDNTKYAEAIATNSYASGDVGVACTSCIIVDTDAPYTQGDQYYLEVDATGDPGDVTATRPTTAANLRQLIGFGLSTTELRAEVLPVREHHAYHPMQSSLVAGEVTAALDSGNFAGPFTNADGEVLYCTFSVPQNCVGVEFARMYSAVEVRSGAADWTTTISGATGGEQWDATTQDATLTGLVASGTAADEIAGSTMTTGFDAAGIIEPDNLVGVKLVHDGGNTDVTIGFGLDITYLVV